MINDCGISATDPQGKTGGDQEQGWKAMYIKKGLAKWLKAYGELKFEETIADRDEGCLGGNEDGEEGTMAQDETNLNASKYYKEEISELQITEIEEAAQQSDRELDEVLLQDRKRFNVKGWRQPERTKTKNNFRFFTTLFLF